MLVLQGGGLDSALLGSENATQLLKEEGENSESQGHGIELGA